ncbi:MAG: hypothetical protein P4L63_03725 [Candidatus Pacebacteria bacterium]|nr:hypothetical protein [Candidatus Paceibacterota bacterium]
MIYIAITMNGLNLEDDYDITPPDNLAPLIHCHKNLFIAQKYCQNIDHMILLNMEDHPIKEEDIDQYADVQNPFFKIRRKGIGITGTNEGDAKIISAMKVFNKEELGLVKVEKTKIQVMDGYSIKGINLQPLKEFINGAPVFSYFRDHEFSVLFLKILSELENVTFYRRTYRFRKTIRPKLVPETNLKEYYQFRKCCVQRLSKLNNQKNDALWFIDCLNKNVDSSFVLQEYSFLLSGALQAKRIFASYDLSDPDFWWEFKNYFKEKYSANNTFENEEVSDATHTTLRVKPHLIFRFTHIAQSDLWTVKRTICNNSNNKETFITKTFDVEYGKYKGLYYILILAKYCPERDEIETTKLYNIVDEIIKEKTNKGSSMPEKSIPGAISDFCCNKRKEFRLIWRKKNNSLQRSFVIGKNLSYFDSNKGIEIIFEDNELEKQYQKILACLNDSSK